MDTSLHNTAVSTTRPRLQKRTKRGGCETLQLVESSGAHF